MIFCLFILMGTSPRLVGLPGALSSCNPTLCLAFKVATGEHDKIRYEKLTTQLESFP